MNHIKPKIFIVEDDMFFAEVVLQKLIANGFDNTHVFYSGERLEQHLHQMPDIVLLDYHLGDTNGINILKKIKAFNPNIQVVLLSAQDRMTVAVDALKYGAFDYLEKKDESLTRLPFIIGRICLLNEEIANRQKSFSWGSTVKKATVGISVFIAILLLLTSL